MRLEDIGFYTLSDARATTSSSSSPIMRGEQLITGRCNFACSYCRKVGGPDVPRDVFREVASMLSQEHVQNVRLSGGEPTAHPHLGAYVATYAAGGAKRIALSTNGSADLAFYQHLCDLGVNDYSISLDACCADDMDKMTGVRGAWATVIGNIEALSRLSYVTVGLVLTPDNIAQAADTIRFAHDLGVADIRIIPAAQYDNRLRGVDVPEELLAAHPILRYRVENIRRGKPVRGLVERDTDRCPLVLDDVAIMGTAHYACVIHLREGGAPIGQVGSEMRRERERWFREHDTHADPICLRNCLDVCVAYNNRWEYLNERDGVAGTLIPYE